MPSSSPDAGLEPELHDLTSDQYERFDVAADHPEVVERLRAEMRKFSAESGARLEGDDG